MDVTISVVTYNSAGTIRPCLASVMAQAGVDFELLVVDNRSADDTLKILSGFADKISVIANGANIGFGAAHNIAARKASASRYQLILNPDATLVSTDTVNRLVQWMDAHTDCGLCGMTIIKGSERISPKKFYPGEKRAPVGLPPLPGDIAWVVGASMMVRRSAFDSIGGFDEDFFLYAEETDLCLRLRKAGHHIGFVGDVEVAHVGGASTGRASAYDVQLRRQTQLHRFYRKHYRKEAVELIVRRDMRRSRWRLLLHTAKGRLLGRAEATRDACGRYRAIFESSRRFLDETT